MIALPLGLRQALEAGDCVLFIGAGVGQHFKRPDGSVAPDGPTLSRELATHFGIATTSTDLAKVSQLVEIRKNRKDLELFIKKTLSNLEPDEVFRWLTTFHWRAIFNTNYDNCIERAYELNSRPPQEPVVISATADMVYTDPRTQVPVFHLHGTISGPRDSNIVITQIDYSRFQQKRSMLWNRLKTEFAQSTLLYIGYSNRDPNWSLILDELTQEFAPSELPRSYRVDPFAEEIDVEILRNRNIETLVCDLSAYRTAVTAAIGDYRQDPDLRSKHQKDVPADLIPAFEKNPASILRLLNSWQYVNGTNFGEKPNTQQFLKGDRPSWALVGAQIPFKRDIEHEIWDDFLLEFITQPRATSRALSLLAPAGYGVTTVLMSLAAKMVRDRVGRVFRLREGASLIEGDVEYAASLFDDEVKMFVVDQAKEYATQVHTCLLQLGATRSRSLFILGERKNEWRMTRTKMRCQEYEILPLSDSEIDRLLDYLQNLNSLGKLGELDRAFQFAIIKENHQKDLLVTMRTAIEGVTNFDAIIIDEYRGITGETEDTTQLARDLYLLICCFYQHGVLIRDNLIAEITGVQLAELYVRLGQSLEGLISFDETDIARGEFAARTRHRVIAEVVWKRCGIPSTREAFLQSAIEKLNLSYRLDKTIFDKFIQNDEVVETFTTFEGKCKFFETACKREPGNPFVTQHYARMLLREGRLNLALSQIDSVLKFHDDIKVLHHTRALILGKLATTSEIEEVGRKWMLQSEYEFNRCISMSSKDSYGYQGLAQLYLDWATKVKEDDESADYIAKCEQVISNGLREVNDRDGLWIVSAGVQKLLGNRPAQVDKLKKAVLENNTSPIARYLLGKVYRQEGKYTQCIDVLDPVIKTQFKEFRSYIEYVRAMIQAGESFSKCIAVLSQCKLDGVSDAGYTALLGGLLYLDSKTNEATELFADSANHGFSFEERNKARFFPNELMSNRKIRWEGKINGVLPGLVFIQGSNFPDIASRVTRVDNATLQRGMKVTFEPVFSARGPRAENLSLVQPTLFP